MRSRSTIRKKALLFVATVLVCELVFVGTLASTLAGAQKEAQKYRHARDVISILDRLAQRIQHSAAIMLTMVDASYEQQVNDPLLAQYQEERAAIPKDFRALHALVESDPFEESKVKELETICSSGLALIEKCRHDLPGAPAPNLVYQYKLVLGEKAREFAGKSDEIIDSYTKIQENIAKEQQKSDEFIYTCLCAGVMFNIIGAIGCVAFFTTSITSRLELLARNSINLAAGKPLEPELQGDDEIALVDRAFHEMAEALQESSRKERVVVENASDLICSINASEQFSALNPAVTQILGYSQEELLGSRYINVIAVDEREKTAQALKRAKDAGANDVETKMICKNGNQIDASWSIQWSAMESSYFCVVHDITARKQVERMKQEFVDMVSHDLRTPLMATEGFLDLLTDGFYGELPDKLVRRTTFIKADVSRLINLVNSLLDLEKMEAGKLQSIKEKIEVSSLIERALSSIKVIADKRNITLKTDTKCATIYADADQIVQVLVNLLANAVKFSPPDSSITIRGIETLSHFEFYIKDEGRGIPKDKLDKIFNRFEQVSISDARDKKGTGLGLAICKAIVDAHGGEIGVVSEEGKGSTFFFKIPLLEEPNDLSEETLQAADLRTDDSILKSS